MATIKPDGECWQPEIEKMPREQLEALQVKKLKESIKVALQSPFYKKRLGDLGITADSINSLADLRKIPFTTKQDLRDNYPYGLVGRSLDDAVRIHSTSGTTGNPCVVVYSEHDICSWANMIAGLPQERHLPELFRLRYVHWRSGLPVWCRVVGNDDRSCCSR